MTAGKRITHAAAIILLQALSATVLLPAGAGAQGVEASAADCSGVAAPLSGQLRIVETRHHDGTPIRALVVFVEEGACVRLEDAEGEVFDVTLRDVHLAPSESEAARLEGLIGREITVDGRPGLPFTAWHVGSVMLFDAELVSVDEE